MSDTIQDSLVNYHNQQFGEAAESHYVNGPARKAVDCRPLCDAQENSSGFHLEVDINGFKKEDIKVDAYEDMLCVWVGPESPSSSDSPDANGKEFGLYQLYQLPKQSDPRLIQATVIKSTLKIWIPNSEPLSATSS
jgi:HSP20 family molecular chaperone IbpA